MAEEVARAAFLCRYAFLVRYGIFDSADEILAGPCDADDGEDADRNGEIASILARVAKCSLNCTANVGGNITATTATAALGGRFKDLGTKYDGIHNLHNRNRGVGGAATKLRCAAKIIVGRAFENADIALTAKKNHLLFKYRDSLKFLNSSGADASLEGELDIELDVDGVKAAIEGDGRDVDLCPSDAGVFDADVGCVRHDIVAEIGQKYTDVLKAIPIATGVENAVCLDADRVSGGRGGAGEFVVCHKRIPPYLMEALTSNALL